MIEPERNAWIIMINFATILKPHKNMKPGGGYCQHGVGYDLEYQTEIGEDEVLITAAIRKIGRASCRERV